jgi:hypothetical protein
VSKAKRISAWLKLLTGVKGCKVFIAAILTGDVATEAELEVKRAVCLVCPHRVERWGSSWCGEPFVDKTSPLTPKWMRTCGCNLAGMLRVGSKRCVQGKHDGVLAALTVERVPLP